MTDADRISCYARVHPDLARLVVTAATIGGHSLRALRGSSNARDLVLARRWVVKRARPRFSYPEIGRALNRDHSTVIHHSRLIARDVEPAIGRHIGTRQLELLP